MDAELWAEIRRLYRCEGWSKRRLAKFFSLDPRTVRRAILALHYSPRGKPAPRPSLVDPYKDSIRALLERHPRLSLVRVEAEIRAMGYVGSHTILGDFVRSIRVRGAPEAYLRIDFPPGDAAQVDWAACGSILVEGKPRRLPAKSTPALLASWHEKASPCGLFEGKSFNLDFHSVPFHGEDPIVERHYVSMRSRRQKSVLSFLAQDADSRSFCYSNADLRKGEEAEEIFRFIAFWEKAHGEKPRHVVFDSQLTTYENYGRLDEMGITFITLRRRSPGIVREIALLPPTAWRTIELDVPTRKFRFPKVFEQTVRLAGRDLRQFFIKDLGHDEPTVLLSNARSATVKALITRYAQRMLIENALSDAVRFFHMDALSSAVGLKVDFDMALLVIASGLYRLLARRMRGYQDAQARQVFRDLLDMPADVAVKGDEVAVKFQRRAHLPILAASGLLDAPVPIPWWGGKKLRLVG